MHPTKSGWMHGQFAQGIDGKRIARKVAPGGAGGDVAIGSERRTMTGTMEGVIGFGGQLTLPMRADGRQGEKLSVPAHQKKSLRHKAGIHTISGVVGGRADRDGAGGAGGGFPRIVQALTAGGEPGGQKQKMPAIQAHGSHD